MRMNLKMRRFMKGAALFLVFAVAFFYLQDVLRWKGERAEDLDNRYEDFVKDTGAGQELDVLYLGTSMTYAAVSPIVVWNECGFTGLNFGTSAQNAMSVYYLLQHVLEVQTPGVVVLDFCDLTDTKLPDDEKYWQAYKKTFDAIENPRLKMDMLYEMNSKSTDFDWTEYLFPIFHYHTRWTELGVNDFGKMDGYRSYQKGALLSQKHKTVQKRDANDTEAAETSAYAVEYYEKIFDLCREKGIQVFGVSFPWNSIGTNASHMAVEEFCEQKGIPYVDFSSVELFEKSGLDHAVDYYNAGHVNAHGSVKLSRLFARILDEQFDLPDRRSDETYREWNEGYRQFLTDFEPWFNKLEQ